MVKWAGPGFSSIYLLRFTFFPTIHPTEIKVGDSAPDFTLPDQDGKLRATIQRIGAITMICKSRPIRVDTMSNIRHLF